MGGVGYIFIRGILGGGAQAVTRGCYTEAVFRVGGIGMVGLYGWGRFLGRTIAGTLWGVAWKVVALFVFGAGWGFWWDLVIRSAKLGCFIGVIWGVAMFLEIFRGLEPSRSLHGRVYLGVEFLLMVG